VRVGQSSQQIYYLLRWSSLADREKKWAALQGDADWLNTRRDTERNGPIVASVTNVLLTPTRYSTLQ
jgi:hypothetical protein